MASGMSLAFLHRKLCFTTGREMPIMSVSWNASSPIMLVGTWPDRITRGMESI